MRFSEDRMEKLRCADGVERDIHIWEPEQPKAVIVAIHGGLAHGGDFVTPALYFRDRGYATVSYDLRGHDRKEKIDIPAFDCFLDDTELFLEWVAEAYPRLPIIMMGHSMGALICGHFGIWRRPDDNRIKGFVLSSPYFGNAIKVPAVLQSLAGVMARLAPKMKVPLEDFTPNLTHDPVIYERHRQDEKDHVRATQASVRFANELTEAQQKLAKPFRRWGYPLFAAVAGDDRLADHKVADKMLKSIDSRLLSYHFYPDNFHENFNEVNREQIFGEIDQWLGNRLGL